MSEMVERVAVKLYEHDKNLAAEAGADFEGTWIRIGARDMDRRLVGYRAIARAAIKAMRDGLTDKMVEAAHSNPERDDEGFYYIDAATMYRAMLDEALKP